MKFYHSHDLTMDESVPIHCNSGKEHIFVMNLNDKELAQLSKTIAEARACIRRQRFQQKESEAALARGEMPPFKFYKTKSAKLKEKAEKDAQAIIDSVFDKDGEVRT